MTLDNLKVGLTFADVNGATVILPEPTNYPTAFAATPGPGSLKLTWTDAVGGQLPQRYLVRVASGALPPLPVDGTPVADDADGSDGLAARNVAYGVRTVTFAGLAAGTSYTCVIYPACNAGAAIDYKTDGAVPWVSAVPLRAPAVIAAESFESGGFGAWTAYSVSSSNNWKVVAGAGVGSGVYFAEVNGFAQTEPSHDWLISPPLDLAKALAASLRFWTQWKYGNNDASNYLKVRVSTDYAGAGDPTPAAWSELPFAIGAADAWTAGGELDLAAYLGKTVYVAFQYYSADTPRRWRVDGIEVSAMLEDKPGTVIILR